jgi:zinc transporter ZupT
MTFVFFITLAGVLGAAVGVMASGTRSFRRLAPFSAGLLMGMAVFLLLPEALAGGHPTLILALCAVGCAVFAGIETILHKAFPSPHASSVGTIPVVLALSLHAALDGWNTATALEVPDQTAAWAFLTGMSLHKLTGGFAIGAVLLAAERSRKRAILWAIGCESLTAVGAASQFAFQRTMGAEWTVWLLAMTGGSFLYLGYHSLQTARHSHGPDSAFPAVLAGVLSVWLISLAH